MKVAIYHRVSTDEQNLKNQIKGCESINKYGEFRLFTDKQSAWKDNAQREQFELIRSLIKKKEIEHLIVWDIDRIYRNRKKIIEFFKFCKMYGCKIHSYRQQFFETLHTMPEPFNEALFDFMLQIMGWFAEDESNKKSDRVKAAIRIKDACTYSYKGNKWGRKQLSTFKQNRINELRKRGQSIRCIASELGISHGAVHKYIQNVPLKKQSKGGVHK